jgi:hypothetical protein
MSFEILEPAHRATGNKATKLKQNFKSSTLNPPEADFASLSLEPST